MPLVIRHGLHARAIRRAVCRASTPPSCVTVRTTAVTGAVTSMDAGRAARASDTSARRVSGHAPATGNVFWSLKFVMGLQTARKKRMMNLPLVVGYHTVIISYLKYRIPCLILFLTLDTLINHAKLDQNSFVRYATLMKINVQP